MSGMRAFSLDEEKEVSLVTSGHPGNVKHRDSDSSSSSTEDNKKSRHERLLKARKRRRTRQYMDDFLKSKDTGLSLLESQAVTGKTETYKNGQDSKLFARRRSFPLRSYQT